MPKTMFEKIWEAHEVRAPEQEGGASLLYVDLHLVHEVTSPRRSRDCGSPGRKVRRPDRTLATADHNVPTDPRERTASTRSATTSRASRSRRSSATAPSSASPSTACAAAARASCT